jgi:hypothetical protein
VKTTRTASCTYGTYELVWTQPAAPRNKRRQRLPRPGYLVSEDGGRGQCASAMRDVFASLFSGGGKHNQRRPAGGKRGLVDARLHKRSNTDVDRAFWLGSQEGYPLQSPVDFSKQWLDKCIVSVEIVARHSKVLNTLATVLVERGLRVNKRIRANTAPSLLDNWRGSARLCATDNTHSQYKYTTRTTHKPNEKNSRGGERDPSGAVIAPAGSVHRSSAWCVRRGRGS